VTSENLGRRGRRWRRIKAEVRARRSACCRCGQRIDYTLAYPDPDSFSVDHYPHPLATHPHLAEEPTNLAAAHLRCNQAAGSRGVTPSLGNPSESW
jgi:5-methylcytosine-specific restriction endonuclease McrA